MNINELFEKIQDEFDSYDINGEFSLVGSMIIWTYTITDETEDADYDDDDDDEVMFNYDASTTEELLLVKYQEDYERVMFFLDTVEESDNRSITDSEIIDESINFKIY